MKILKHIFVVAIMAAAAMAASCGKEDTDKNQQESYIESIADNLLASDSTVTVRYAGGSTIVTVVHGTGEELSSDGEVIFYYGGHYLNSASISKSNLFMTNYREYADDIGWELSDTSVYHPDTAKVSNLVKGLKNGIVGVQSGEECYIMFNEDYGFGKKSVGNIPANSALAYHLWILGVANN